MKTLHKSPSYAIGIRFKGLIRTGVEKHEQKPGPGAHDAISAKNRIMTRSASYTMKGRYHFCFVFWKIFWSNLGGDVQVLESLCQFEIALLKIESSKLHSTRKFTVVPAVSTQTAR